MTIEEAKERHIKIITDDETFKSISLAAINAGMTKMEYLVDLHRKASLIFHPFYASY